MLTQFYPPLIGGEGQHVRNLSAKLVARGHEVAVATLWQNGLPEREDDQGVQVYRLRSTSQTFNWLYQQGGRRQLPPAPDPATVGGIRQIVVQHRPTIVHAHNWMVHSFLPLKGWSRTPLVLSLHDYSLACSIKSFMRADNPCDGAERLKCLRCAARHYGALKGVPVMLTHQVTSATAQAQVAMFLPVSQAVAEGNQLRESGLPYQVVSNFIADNAAEPAGDPSPYLNQLPTNGFLLYVGALTRIKGINTMLEAYAGMRNAPELVLIGRTDADTPQTFPTGVRVLHNWPNYAVMAAWKHCIVGLVPSIWPEPCATVAMEAMACGRPVIASRTGGLVDIVEDGRTGLLVAPGDANALSAALTHLLADPQRCVEMGRAAEERVERFRASSVVPAIEAVYDKVIGCNRI